MLHECLAFYGIDSLANVNIVCDCGSNYVLAFKDFQAILCYGHRMNNIVRIASFQNKNQRTDALVINPINILDARSSSTTPSQDDHSGHRILQESVRKSRGNRQFPQENSGNQRKTEAVFQPEIVSVFFQMISGRFLPE